MPSKTSAKKDSAKKKAAGSKKATPRKAAPKKNDGRVTAVAAAEQALRKAGKPMTASDLIKKALANKKVTGMKGKTPEATLASKLYTMARDGKTFKRVGTGRPATFDLIER